MSEPAREHFAWDRLMRLGMGVLRLPPDVFWAMTPREFESAVRGAFGELACELGASRPVLEDLMLRYPDKQEETRDYG